jgi:hypothetical protein
MGCARSVLPHTLSNNLGLGSNSGIDLVVCLCRQANGEMRQVPAISYRCPHIFGSNVSQRCRCNPHALIFLLEMFSPTYHHVPA